MARITWTVQAISDVEDICEYISKDSFRYAQLFADKIFTSVEKLAIYPKLGRIVPEFNTQQIREIIIGNFRLVYRSQKEEIEILTVYHSARLFDI